MLDMIQIFALFVGGSSPGVLGTKNCLMYVTIDFEGGAVKDARSVHNRTKVTTEAGMSILGALSLIGARGAQDII